MIFMVLSSWQCHCESSPGSFDERRLSAEVATNPQTKPTDLDCESAKKTWQLPSTSTIAILLLLSPRVDTHFTVPRRVEGWVDLGTAVRVCSPCPRLYIAVAVVINTNCPRWDSNLGPLTPQSGMLLYTGHCRRIQVELTKSMQYYCRTTAFQPPVLTLGGICVPPTVNYLQYPATSSTVMAVGPSQSPAPQPGTLSRILSGTPPPVQTVSDVC